MADQSIFMPVALVTQFVMLAFSAGVGWNSLANLKERQKEDREKHEKDLKEATAKAEADRKEQSEKRDRQIAEMQAKHEAEREKLRIEVKTDVNQLRTETVKTMSDLRAESQAGREAIRLEMSTMIQTTSEVRAERINQAFTDFDKLADSINDFREENRNNHTSLSNALRDMHWRVHALEEDAKEHGWKKSSERRMPAVTGEEQPPPPYGGRHDIRGGFDPKRGR